MKRNSKKLHFALALGCALIISSSCKNTVPVVADSCELPDQEQIDRSPASEGGDEEVIRECVIPEPDSQAQLEINATLRDFDNFPEQRREKMLEAIERLKIVVNSVEFKDKVYDYIYNGSYQFVDNLGLSNEEIYDKIMDGVESLSNDGIDGEMDVDITLYYSNNSTVGYTYPNVTRVWVNDKFLQTNTLGQVAANVIHEWTHKIGFNHDFSSTTRRSYSVPYGIGSIVRELVDNM